MSQLKKLYDRVKNNPKQIRFEEIRKLLIQAGFQERNAGGSHYVYAKGAKRITVPRRQPYILAVYIKLGIQALEGEMEDE